MKWTHHLAAKWVDEKQTLKPIRHLQSTHLGDLMHLQRQISAFDQNLKNFLAGESYMHSLLWGARGTGKSSMVRGFLQAYAHQGLRAVQLHTDQLESLPGLVEHLRQKPFFFMVFLDDLSLQRDSERLHFLKRVMDGALEAPATNVILVATSNRRHLVPEFAADNQNTQLKDGALHFGDGVEDALSLADRFGLWLSFHPFNPNHYWELVQKLTADLPMDEAELRTLAQRFSSQRGVSSGRTAQQFNVWIRQQITPSD